MFSIRNFALASVAGIALTVAIPGCQPERPDVIPTSAQIGSSGNGILHFMAPNDGMAYVYDQTQNRLVWSGTVVRGETVDVNPQTNRVSVGGTVRANKVLVGNDRIDIYFDQAFTNYLPPPPPSSNSVTVTPNVTVQPSNTPPSNGVTVQPGVTVTPAPAPAPQNP